jgi:PTH1 family peptidyl-tRNA hydrolase
MWLVVGLGNPGPKYAGNRHNIGFMVIDEIASKSAEGGFSSKFGGQLAGAQIAGQRAVLLKPMEYMNLSGAAVQKTAAFYQLERKDVVVVHDEIDLPLGTLRVKVGGGHGGHNGLRSIIQELGGADFVRVRCGVGRPAHDQGVVHSHVLGDFTGSDKTEAQILVKEAADAVTSLIDKGPTFAMNRHNGKA